MVRIIRWERKAKEVDQFVRWSTFEGNVWPVNMLEDIENVD